MRVKRGKTSRAKHTKLRRATKGYRMTKRRLVRVGKEAFLHAGEYAYHGRKLKKRDFRRLWVTRISEAVKKEGLTYNTFIAALKKANVDVDRKVMANLITDHPDAFTAIVDTAKKAN